MVVFFDNTNGVELGRREDYSALPDLADTVLWDQADVEEPTMYEVIDRMFSYVDNSLHLVSIVLEVQSDEDEDEDEDDEDDEDVEEGAVHDHEHAHSHE